MAVLKFAKKKKAKKKTSVKSKIKRKAIKKKTVKKKAARKKSAKAVKKKKTLESLKAEKIIKLKRRLSTEAVLAPNEKLVGRVTHYFPKVKAAVFKLSEGELSLGDTIHVKGHTSDFTQEVKSMQIEHIPIETAKIGDEIGLKVNSRVRIHDDVYKLL